MITWNYENKVVLDEEWFSPKGNERVNVHARICPLGWASLNPRTSVVTINKYQLQGITNSNWEEVNNKMDANIPKLIAILELPRAPNQNLRKAMLFQNETKSVK